MGLPQLANMAALSQYDWLLAIITIAFCFSAFGNGANDVANSYATSVAARTLTMIQVGFLSIVTEFVGAVALGARVTSTIKNGIISIDRFEDRPGVLMLAMTCATAYPMTPNPSQRPTSAQSITTTASSTSGHTHKSPPP